MKPNNLTNPRRKRRATLIAMVSAGMLSAAGTGSILLGLSGTADGQTRRMTVQEARGTGVNMDSLYTAKTAETTTIDTCFAAELSPEQTLNGRVSWYGPGFYGRRTANGERFGRESMTVAHRSLPFGTILRVIDTQTDRAVLVRVNDRGPFCRGRILDMSEGAASRLGIKGKGTANVRVEIFNQGTLASRTTTFDGEGQAVMPHGYSVLIKQTESFDEAYALQQRLEGQGERKAFLTEVRVDGKSSYQVSLGLFSSQRLCQSLAADLTDDFASPEVVKYQQGRMQRFDLADGGVASN